MDSGKICRSATASGTTSFTRGKIAREDDAKLAMRVARNVVQIVVVAAQSLSRDDYGFIG